MLAVELHPGERGEEAPHAHAANEFFLCTAGEGAHRTHLGEYGFSAGELSFFPRGQLHEHWAAGPVCAAISVRFRDAALVPESEVDRQAHVRLMFLKRRSFVGRNRIALTAPARRELERHFREAVSEDAKRVSGYKCLLKGIALQAIILIAREPDVGFVASRRDRAAGLVRVLEALDEDPARPVTVAAMAKLAGMSRSHFHAAFKQATGATLLDHVARLRFGSATHLLSSSATPVVDVCYQCGFPSMSRFYDVFKRFAGVPPAAFRRRTAQPAAGWRGARIAD
ncbi:MAG: helix-turn-helix transcriptional regulator [Kiritimatiellae bacterium]|nr:helix-turn-helix transcriptional regulator [Kiritimatiellia bacterium]